MIKVGRLKTSSREAFLDIKKLLTQLRSDRSEHGGSLPDLTKMVKNEDVVVVVARDGSRIIGMGILYAITKVGKRVGYVEDVVVDSGYRGHGLGKRVMEELIAAAKKKKLKNLFLTSKPERIAANALYQKLGFEVVKTNPYRLTL